jgi:N-acyl-D-amino-acid deacylase
MKATAETRRAQRLIVQGAAYLAFLSTVGRSLFAIMLLALPVQAANYDILIRHGRVIDGTGNPAFFADVAIEKGRIAAIGKLTNDVANVIDASGLVVAPGFIDVHTHAEDVLDLPLAENFVRMGVTTLMLGNCGGSTADVKGFLARVEATNVSVNVGTLIGHGTVRGKAMGGSFMRPPSAEEMDAMKSMVGRAMEEGAFGLSTGLIYLPGSFAKTEEIIDLAKIVARHDGIYTSHMRNESNEIGDALEELFRIAREAKIRAEISHIKISGGAAHWGKTETVLKAIEGTRAEGLDITQDIYVYTASSTGLAQLIPESAREGGKFMERLSDPEERKRIVAEMKSRLRTNQRDDYGYVMLAEYKKVPSLNGLRVPEAANKFFGSNSVDVQINLILTIQTNGGASAVFHGISEEDLRQFLKHSNTMIASDSGVRHFGQGVPHPRGYGNNARVLSHYVRELQLIRLEDAIRRMTSLPAATFRIRDRGLVREGSWADLVIFDPKKVQDHGTFEDPHHYATGFARVFVNGAAVVENDSHTQTRPGRALRHSQ